MADDIVGLEPARTDRGEDCERGGDERRLLHGGVEQLGGVAVETETFEVELRGAASALVHRARLGDRVGDVAAHAGLDGALTGEAEGNLHAAAPFNVQRMSALPHVRPAPIPVMRTSFPGARRPSATASAIASGIEPEEVLP